MTDASHGLSLWATLGLRMTGLVVLAVVVTTAGAAQGQAPATSYEMSLYDTAATAPFVVREIPLASMTCGQDPPKQAPVPVVNPTRLVIHDLDTVGSVCWVPLNITALPAGFYDVTLRAVNAEGHGPETEKVRFERRRAPDPPMGFRLVRD